MGKGKKQRIQEKKKTKANSDSEDECKHVDAEDLEEHDAAPKELTKEEQAFIDFGFDKLDKGKLLQIVKETEDMDEIIALTCAKDKEVRLKATREMCPWHVKAERKEFWDRIFALANDEDDNIRYQVLHNMWDGSPPSLEDKVIKTLEIFNRDKNKKIRRKAHQVMGSYLHGGEWNIM